jgi:spermidine synthase
LLAPSRQEVLILGGGDGLALREVLKYPDVRAVTLVDLDPEMTRLSASHPEMLRLNQGSLNHGRVTRMTARGIVPGETAKLGGNLASDRFKTGRLVENATVHSVNVDAAEFVKSAPGRYHVIIMDFPDPNSPDLAKLYGRPFYDQLHPLLMPGGVMVQQSGSPVQAREAFLCIGRTLQAAGFDPVPYHDHVPSFGEWGWWIAIAGQSAATTKERLNRVSTCPVPCRYWNPELLHASLAFGNDQLQSRHDDITTPSHPAVYQHHLSGWNPDEFPMD